MRDPSRDCPVGIRSAVRRQLIRLASTGVPFSPDYAVRAPARCFRAGDRVRAERDGLTGQRSSL